MGEKGRSQGIRIPLQVGTSAAGSLARAGLYVGLALAVVALAVFFGLLPMVVIAVGLICLAAVQIAAAVRSWPLDAVVGPEGMRIEGLIRGRAIAWREIDPDRCRVEVREEQSRTIIGLWAALEASRGQKSEEMESMSKAEVARLHVARKGGRDMVIAQAESPVEIDSLLAFCDTIRGMARRSMSGGGGEAPALAPGPEGTNLLACSACSAPASPADEAEVECVHCGARVAVPDGLRARVRAGRMEVRSREAVTAALGDMVRQPGAVGAGLRIAAGQAAVAAAMAAAAAGMLALDTESRLAGVAFAALVAVPGLVLLLAFAAIRVHLSGRSAIRLLASGLGARRSPGGDGAVICRNCGAPLPEAGGDLMVKCAYCDAENVLVIDLPAGAVRRSRDQVASVEEVMELRDGERRQWTVLAALAAVLIAGAVAAWVACMVA